MDKPDEDDRGFEDWWKETMEDRESHSKWIAELAFGEGWRQGYVDGHNDCRDAVSGSPRAFHSD